MNLGLGLNAWPYGNMIQYQYVQIESVLRTVFLFKPPSRHKYMLQGWIDE